MLTKKSAASGDENGRTISFLHFERRTEGSVRLIACPVFIQDASSYNSRRVIRLHGSCHLVFGLDGLRPSSIKTAIFFILIVCHGTLIVLIVLYSYCK